MDNWYQRFIKWFSDIPPDIPATVIRKPDHTVVIVHDPIASYFDSAFPRTTVAAPPSPPSPPKPLAPAKKMNARRPVVKKIAKKKRKV